MTVLIVGDSPVLAQSLESGGIEATYLNYVYSRSLKEKGFPVLLDLGKAPIPYQGLAAATRRSYIRQNPQIIDALMRGFVETVAFIHKPENKELVVKSLMKNLRLKNRPGCGDRLSGTPMALQPRYQADRSGNSKYGEASRAREPEGQIRQNGRHCRRNSVAAAGEKHVLPGARGQK